MRTKIALLILGLALVAPRPARAQADAGSLTVGLYAPTVAFASPAARFAFVSALAEHLASTTGKKVTGRVYARSRDFAAAVKNKEIQYAVIDAPYAAAIGLPYEALATATRGGQPRMAWEVVAGSGIGKLSDLRGKRLSVPGVGARQDVFVTNVLFEGEVPAKFFGSVEAAPDPLSAVTAVGLGRADAAVVPAGLALPAGTKRLATMGEIPGPMFVALPGADAAVTAQFKSKVTGSKPTSVFDGWAAAASGDYDELRRSYAGTRKRGVLAVPPPAKLELGPLLGDRAFKIEETAIETLAVAK